MSPLSDVFVGEGYVREITVNNYGWIESEDLGELYFPFARFQQPDDRIITSPDYLVNKRVRFQFCKALPGARGQWRAIHIKLIDGGANNQLIDGGANDQVIDGGANNQLIDG